MRVTGSIPFHFLDWTGDLLQDGWVQSPSVGVREILSYVILLKKVHSK